MNTSKELFSKLTILEELIQVVSNENVTKTEKYLAYSGVLALLREIDETTNASFFGEHSRDLKSALLKKLELGTDSQGLHDPAAYLRKLKSPQCLDVE
ncbi:hypothetical protein PSEHALCIP103_01546 [Pseudoalteromonas haloplanktis]|uniref:Uncharacterized protein n=1 Tax=Pseudoalteromonas haloplanktis TaxID=228 RepID=A0A9W4QWW5_PSEHA|nr:hypothetical protein [Pseudoalteromonas haloplanktis]CAH9056889.1 hypothetical protein PSEHALCIP103_01546 [Pseudoalteromonas haloplanktis]